MNTDVASAFVNWQQIILDLREWGWTDSEIARRTGTPRYCITKLKNGSQRSISFTRGYQLLQLYEEQWEQAKSKPMQTRLTQKLRRRRRASQVAP